MPDKTKWDVSNENFDYFFANQSKMMTESQRLSLPKDLYFKLFKRGGDVNSESTYKLSFLAKIFILIKALRKRVFILVEDENGMTEEEYFKYREMLFKHKYTISSSDELITDSVFVLANKDVMDTYSRLNRLSTSNAYNYLIKSKNSVRLRSKQSDYVTQVNYICKMLAFYESNRKRIAMQMGLEFTEWLVLIYLFHGGMVKGSDIYKSWYKHSYNSSSRKIKQAFGTLQIRGFVNKIGESRGAKLEITALGRDKVIDIMDKFVLNQS